MEEWYVNFKFGCHTLSVFLFWSFCVSLFSPYFNLPLFLCLPISLSLSLSFSSEMYFCLSLCLFICASLSVFQYVFLSFSLSISLCLSLCLSFLQNTSCISLHFHLMWSFYFSNFPNFFLYFVEIQNKFTLILQLLSY